MTTHSAPDRARTRRRFLLVVVLLHLGVLTAGMWLGLTRPAPMTPLSIGDLAWGLSFMLPFPVVGALVAARVPENPIGWLFIAGPMVATIGITLGEVANHQVPDVLPVLPYLGDTLFLVGLSTLVAYLLLLFPTGKLPSRRWSWVGWGGGIGVAVTAIWSMVQPCNLILLDPDLQGMATCATSDPAVVVAPNPFGFAYPGGTALWGVIGGVSSAMIVVALFAGAASLFLRYRRASIVERARLRWPLAVLAIVIPGTVLLILVEVLFGAELPVLSVVVFMIAEIGLPVSIGVAITRYRLFDIDRIFSRTVAYVLVVALLAGLFAALVALPALVVGSGRVPSWAVAAATLAVFVLFDPFRKRIVRAVDRRFNRSRYDAARVVEGFESKVRDASDIGAITLDLSSAVGDVFQPGAVAVWMRESQARAATETGVVGMDLGGLSQRP